MSKLTSILLLILGSSVTSNCQWISSGTHDWEASLSPESSFPTSLLSLRSSEERPLKSPLASHDFLPSSIEAQPFTMDRRIMKRKDMRLPRKQSPVPSADKWWMETMRHRQNDGLVRITPYEYPSYPSFGSLEGPEFLPMPIKYRKANRKNFKKAPKETESLEVEKVSDNPPEFLPSEVETLEVNPPLKFNKKPDNKKRTNKLPTTAATATTGSTSAYNLRSEALESIIKDSDDSEPKPLIPDKMLGNDMMFHHNRLEEVARSGNDVDDPNDDFELLQ